MATWTNIPDTVLEPGKPARSVDALALRDNPIAIAERAANAPRMRIHDVVTLNSGSGNWIVPAGVYKLKVTLVGGGQAASMSSAMTDYQGAVVGVSYTNGGAGGNTTFNGLIAAGGGSGVQNGWVSNNGGKSTTISMQGYDFPLYPKDGAGGSIAIHAINVTPAQVIPFKVGAGGASDAGSGQIIIEY